MDKYFIAKGAEKKGPFTIEELKKMDLTNEYLIWKNDFVDWKPIASIPELQEDIMQVPPPTPFEILEESNKKNIGEVVTKTLIIFLILCVFIFFIMGGFKDDDYLLKNYGYGENAIFGGPEVIKKGLIYTSLFISTLITLIISYFDFKKYKKQ